MLTRSAALRVARWLCRQKYHSSFIITTAKPPDITRPKIRLLGAFPMTSLARQPLTPFIARRVDYYSTSVRVTLADASLDITYLDDDRSISYRWLRVNCRCPKCLNPQTLQKNFPVHHFHSSIRPSSFLVDDQTLSVNWSDGHVSVYDVKWLYDNVYPGRERGGGGGVVKTPWNKALIYQESIPIVPYDHFMSTDAALESLLSSVLKYGFGIVGGAPANAESTKSLAERICFIQETLYGVLLVATADLAFPDTAYTNLALGAHTDGTYWTIPPGIEVFHRLEHTGEGGETLLVDGLHCVELLRQMNPDAVNFLAKAKIHHEYRSGGGDLRARHHMRSLDSVVHTHPVTGEFVRLRYNQYDRAPIQTLNHEDVNTFYAALTELACIIEDPANEHWIKLPPDHVLFVDNWRVMHGRASFTGKRLMATAYLTRDDWMSKARVHGLVPPYSD